MQLNLLLVFLGSAMAAAPADVQLPATRLERLRSLTQFASCRASIRDFGYSTKSPTLSPEDFGVILSAHKDRDSLKSPLKKFFESDAKGSLTQWDNPHRILSVGKRVLDVVRSVESGEKTVTLATYSDSDVNFLYSLGSKQVDIHSTPNFGYIGPDTFMPFPHSEKDVAGDWVLKSSTPSAKVYTNGANTELRIQDGVITSIKMNGEPFSQLFLYEYDEKRNLVCTAKLLCSDNKIFQADVYQIENLVVNCPIADEEMKFSVPAGTTVVDNRNGKRVLRLDDDADDVLNRFLQ